MKRDSESGVRLIQTAIFMATQDSLKRFAFLVLALIAPRLGAQVIETPVPFDSAGKVRVLTPPLVARFALTPPLWRVTTEFAEARLYGASTGDTLLVVSRRSGVIERYALAPADVASLRAAVNAALTQTGIFVAEDASQSARSSFVRNQLILSLLLYGPGAAALANDGKTGTVLYLAGAGGTFFALSAVSRNMHVTRAQNHLSTDGALRGFAVANGVLYAIAGDFPDRTTVSGVGLAGAVLGSVAGFQRGRRLSDAEAHASSSASTLAALTTLGVLGAANAVESRNSERTVAAALVATGIGGYFAGPAYPRRARFMVTAGDVNILWVGGVLGTAAAVTPFVDSDADENVMFATATTGLLAGVVLTNSAWARRYDHSMSDVFQTWLGTIAGGLLGGALVVLTEPDDGAVISALITAGGLAGAIAAHAMARPTPAGVHRASLMPPTRVGRVELELSPLSLATAAAGIRGTHPLVALRF